MIPITTAHAMVRSAADVALDLADYTGSASDLSFLRTYVLDHVNRIYGVDAGTFDTASVLSTTILRDFVHRASRQQDTVRIYSEIDGAPPPRHDVGLLRHQAMDLCGPTAMQLYHV